MTPLYGAWTLRVEIPKRDIRVYEDMDLFRARRRFGFRSRSPPRSGGGGRRDRRETQGAAAKADRAHTPERAYGETRKARVPGTANEGVGQT
jgi:hypothetical protein